MACFQTFLWILGSCAFAPVALAQPQREAVRPQAAEIDLWPLRGADPARREAEIVPVRAGDKVLVSSSLRLFGYDAASGALAWKTEPPAGWEALDEDARALLREGFDVDALLVAPAAGERIAVAALQLPRARKPHEDWQGILTTAELPERRLFAFELASGRPLWDHRPPASWDGSSGTFPQRMHVTGAPLVVGEMVLVPCTADSTSIDGHVAAYALGTGQLLWSTFVARGQVVRLYLQDSQAREFAAAPLVASADGRSLIVQTGLGRVAALARTDGAIQWSTCYAAIPLPKLRSYNAPRRRAVWRMAPPIVVGDVVVATPRDSDELLALDLASGALLWSLSNEALRTLAGGLALDHLVAARDGVIYLGGSGVAAFTRSGGLRSEGAWQALWTVASEPSTSRSQVVGASLFACAGPALLELDPATGAKLASYPLAPLRGLLVTDEALFGVEEHAFLRIER